MYNISAGLHSSKGNNEITMTLKRKSEYRADD